ncbi:mast cell protease 1-like isoform X2 [Daphnia pulex]|nr:mast cell protease 1-like isoform X2 [Daphnia pulex]
MSSSVNPSDAMGLERSNSGMLVDGLTPPKFGYIIGGSEVNPDDSERHKYMVHIRRFVIDDVTTNDTLSIPWCGGTLISEWHILTAAHCLFNDQGELSNEIEIFLGVNAIPPNGLIELLYSTSTKRTVSMDGILIHDDFNQLGKGENDIAILKMDTRVVLNENPGVSLIKLPEKCSDCTVDYAGKRIIAVGWGLTSSDGMSSPNMMQVELAVNSKEECEKQFSVAYNDEYQLCTVPSSTKGTCQGDSGGPIIVDGVQIGITSHGPAKCEEGGVYTRVSAYINNGWIADKMKDQKQNLHFI